MTGLAKPAMSIHPMASPTVCLVSIEVSSLTVTSDCSCLVIIIIIIIIIITIIVVVVVIVIFVVIVVDIIIIIIIIIWEDLCHHILTCQERYKASGFDRSIRDFIKRPVVYVSIPIWMKWSSWRGHLVREIYSTSILNFFIYYVCSPNKEKVLAKATEVTTAFHRPERPSPSPGTAPGWRSVG